MREGFPRSPRKEHARHELDPCQREWDEQVPPDERAHIVDQREPDEEAAEREPQPHPRRRVQREKDVIAEGLRLESGS